MRIPVFNLYDFIPPRHGHPVKTRYYGRRIYGEILYWGGVGPWIQGFYCHELERDDETNELIGMTTCYLGSRQYVSYSQALLDVY